MVFGAEKRKYTFWKPCEAKKLTKLCIFWWLTSKCTTKIAFVETLKPRNRWNCWPPDLPLSLLWQWWCCTIIFFFVLITIFLCACFLTASLFYVHMQCCQYQRHQWPTFRGVFYFIQAWCRGLLVSVRGIFFFSSDPAGPHKLQTEDQLLQFFLF